MSTAAERHIIITEKRSGRSGQGALYGNSYLFLNNESHYNGLFSIVERRSFLFMKTIYTPKVRVVTAGSGELKPVEL